MRALIVLGAVLSSMAASAEPTQVYVEVMEIDKSIKADPGSMTSPICMTLDDNPDVDVSCGPDIQQILSFAATAGLIGGGAGGAPSAVAERLRTISVVVRPKLKQGARGYYVVVEISHRAEGFGPQVMSPGAPIGTVVMKTGRKSVPVVLERLPQLAESIAAKILTPEGKLPPPPAPVK